MKKPTIKMQKLIEEKTVREEEAYDEHYTGTAILVVPISLSEQGIMGEVPVPEFYFKQFWDKGEVAVLGDCLTAPIFYTSDLGAVFGSLAEEVSNRRAKSNGN